MSIDHEYYGSTDNPAKAPEPTQECRCEDGVCGLHPGQTTCGLRSAAQPVSAPSPEIPVKLFRFPGIDRLFVAREDYLKLESALRVAREERDQTQQQADARETKWANDFRRMENRLGKFLDRAEKSEKELIAEREARKQEAVEQFNAGWIDEICCEYGPPEWVQTEDGEAWYWQFSGHELPVADTLSELFRAAKDLQKRALSKPVSGSPERLEGKP